MRRIKAATDTLVELALIYLALLLIASVIFMAVEQRSFLESF